MTRAWRIGNGALGSVAGVALLLGCGDDDGGSSTSGDAVVIEVRSKPDTPMPGGGSAVPGLWLIATAPETRPADGRQEVATLRAAGAEVVRTDARGRAALRSTTGTVLVCHLGSSDEPGPVAVFGSCAEMTVGRGRKYQLSFGEAGLVEAR